MACGSRIFMVLILANAILNCACRSILKVDRIKRSDKSHRVDMLLNCLSYEKNCRDIWEYMSVRDPVERNTVYLYGNVYTVNKKTEWQTRNNKAEALVIDKDGKIVFIGKNDKAKEYINRKSTVYDLYGATVLPGFHDVHMHPLEAKSKVGGTCELSVDVDPQNMIDHIRDCSIYQIGTKWVLGHGHSIRRMLKYIKLHENDDDYISPKELLDKAVPNSPAIMMETTSHSVWVNSQALAAANITKHTENRPGGIIMKDKYSGEPNGILFENEGNVIMELALTPVSKELGNLNYKGLKDALSEIAENGITSICDARLYWQRGHVESWNRACENGDIKIRAISGLWAYPHVKDDDAQIEKLKKLYTNKNLNCNHKRSQIKLYSDGLLDSTTAKLFEKYKENFHLPGITGNKGMNYFVEDRLIKYIEALQSFKENGEGFDFHIHVIGDQAANEALNAIEKAAELGYKSRKINKENPPRHRLTHVELVKDSDIARFKTLDVTADFQVAGTFTLPFYRPKIEELIGEKRAENFIPVWSFTEAGVRTTFSSDWDVSGLNPFMGIKHAINRGNQSVTIKEAVEMYTINPAYVMRQEHLVGSLEINKEADLVIINKDFIENGFDNIQVLQTVVRGEIIYQRHYVDAYNEKHPIIEDVTKYFV